MQQLLLKWRGRDSEAMSLKSSEYELESKDVKKAINLAGKEERGLVSMSYLGYELYIPVSWQLMICVVLLAVKTTSQFLYENMSRKERRRSVWLRC